MSTGDVLAVVAATVVTMLVARARGRARRARRARCATLRVAADVLHDETLPLLDERTRAVVDAATRSTASSGSSRRRSGSATAVDGASRLATRTLASPVVKAMAFGTGVSRAAQRLRDGETPAPRVATSRVGAGEVEGVVMFKRLLLAHRRLRARRSARRGRSRAATAPRRAERLAPADVVDRWSGNVRVGACTKGRDAMRDRGEASSSKSGASHRERAGE